MECISWETTLKTILGVKICTPSCQQVNQKQNSSFFMDINTLTYLCQRKKLNIIINNFWYTFSINTKKKIMKKLEQVPGGTRIPPASAIS